MHQSPPMVAATRAGLVATVRNSLATGQHKPSAPALIRVTTTVDVPLVR